jgi:hypothetical protein
MQPLLAIAQHQHPSSASSPEWSRSEEAVTLQAIRHSLEDGTLSREEAFLEIVRFAIDDKARVEVKNRFATQRRAILDEHMRSDQRVGTDPALASFIENEMIRCFTPYLIEFQDVIEGSSPESKKIAEYLNPSTTNSFQYYDSPSGKFRLRYVTSGTDSVSVIDSTGSGIPDYIEKAALYADSTWNYLVGTLGFEDPISGSISQFEIRFRKFSGIYGQYPIGASYFEVHSTFVGFPANQDPEGNILGALKATIAHEFKHAIQYKTNRFRGNAGTFNWVELDATMTEEVVFSTAKDYLNYLNNSASIFGVVNPYTPRAYYQAPFGLFYGERFGEDFWVDTWREIRTNNYMLVFDAMRNVLQTRGFDFDEEFLRNMTWHYASGARSAEAFGFNDRSFYPNIKITENLAKIAPSYASTRSLLPYSTRFFEIQPDGLLTGPAVVGLTRNNDALIASIVAYNLDNSIEKHVLSGANRAGFDGVRLTTNWENVSRIGIIVANPGSVTGNVQILAGTDDAIGGYKYADFSGNAVIDLMDVENILTTVANQLATTIPGRFISADVSGNQQISAYDGSLVLQYLSNKIDFFPVDASETGFGPELDWFRNETPPAAKHVAAETHDFTASTSWRHTVGNTPDNDTLSIYISVDSGQYASFYNEITFNPSELSFQKFDFPGLNSIISGDNDVNAKQLSRSDTFSHSRETKKRDNSTSENLAKNNKPSSSSYEIYIDQGSASNVLHDSTEHSSRSAATSRANSANAIILYENEQQSETPNETPGVNDQLETNLITTSSDTQIMVKYQISGGTIRFAVASDEYAFSDEFFVLKFVPLIEATTTVTFNALQLDEHPRFEPALTIQETVVPVDPVGIENPSTLPLKTELHQNYPNPFNPTTNIRYNLQNPSFVEISVYDVTGRLVSTLVNGHIGAGSHSVTFRANDLSSGIYIVRLKTSDASNRSSFEVHTRKMMFIK